MERNPVSNRTFTEKWCRAHTQGQTVAELSRDLGLTYAECHYRFRRLREIGVSLPLLPGQKPREFREAAALNKIKDRILQSHGGGG